MNLEENDVWSEGRNINGHVTLGQIHQSRADLLQEAHDCLLAKQWRVIFRIFVLKILDSGLNSTKGWSLYNNTERVFLAQQDRNAGLYTTAQRG